jgi:hypothetical protein
VEKRFTADGEKLATHREKLEAYAARIHHVELPGTSLRIADVRMAVDSTKWGQLPLSTHTETCETAWRRLESYAGSPGREYSCSRTRSSSLRSLQGVMTY